MMPVTMAAAANSENKSENVDIALLTEHML